MTSEMGELWNAIRRDRSERGHERRVAEALNYEHAATVAESRGLRLRKCSDVHYQLFPHLGGWCISLYPGNRRIRRDRGPAPRLAVSKDEARPWLVRCVEAVPR